MHNGLFNVSGATIGRAWRLQKGTTKAGGFVLNPPASAT